MYALKPSLAAAAVASRAPTAPGFAPVLAAVGALTLLRLAFLWTSGLGLYADEAQYWLWAQSVDLGYFSKPPMIAWIIAGTTALCGDGEACVRSASPLFHGGTALMVWLIAQRIAGARTAWWSALTYATLPAVSLSAGLMTTDVPLLFFWAVALYAFLRLIDGCGIGWALLLGAAVGLGLLSKYAMAFFVPCAALYLVLTPGAARRIGATKLVIAAALGLLVFAPNLAWNWEHGLATFRHTSANANLGARLFRPDSLAEFFFSQFAVFGPILFAYLVWRSRRLMAGLVGRLGDGDRFLVAFSAPVLLVMLVQSLLSRAHANWAAIAYVAATVLVVCWLIGEGRKRLLAASLALHLVVGGLLMVGLVALPVAELPFAGRVVLGGRLLGWDALGKVIADRIAMVPGAKLLADDRMLLSSLIYYQAAPLNQIRIWNPHEVPENHLELTASLRAGDTGPFLLIAKRPDPGPLARHFARAVLVERIDIPLGGGVSRSHWLYRLDGFAGY